MRRLSSFILIGSPRNNQSASFFMCISFPHNVWDGWVPLSLHYPHPIRLLLFQFISDFFHHSQLYMQTNPSRFSSYLAVFHVNLFQKKKEKKNWAEFYTTITIAKIFQFFFSVQLFFCIKWKFTAILFLGFLVFLKKKQKSLLNIHLDFTTGQSRSIRSNSAHKSVGEFSEIGIKNIDRFWKIFMS
jgi:hypothetical protein